MNIYVSTLIILSFFYQGEYYFLYIPQIPTYVVLVTQWEFMVKCSINPHQHIIILFIHDLHKLGLNFRATIQGTSLPINCVFITLKVELKECSFFF